MVTVTDNMQTAFEDVINEKPDDMGTRLIFADWLQDQELPQLVARGEFIQVQCELSTTPIHSQRRKFLQQREQSLLGQYGSIWAEPFSSLVKSFEFRNGFIERVTFEPEDFIRVAERLGDIPPIREVTVTTNRTNFQLICDNPYRNRITHWVLDGTGWVSLRESIGFSGFTNLRSIRLKNLSRQGLAILADPYLPILENLDLSHNSISLEDIQFLARQTSLSSLQSLSLAYSPIPNPKAEILDQLSELSCLQSLDLLGVYIGSEGVEALAKSTSLSHLKTLRLGFNRIGDLGLIALANSKAFPKLSRLYLASNQLQGPGLDALAESPLLSQLTDLDLDYNDICSTSLGNLVNSKYLDRIKILYVRGSKPISRILRNKFFARLGEKVCCF